MFLKTFPISDGSIWIFRKIVLIMIIVVVTCFSKLGAVSMMIVIAYFLK